MPALAIVIVLVVLAIVMLVITQPLRRPSMPELEVDAGPPASIAELEAAREAKYAEIREAELDHQMGKLSDEDYKAIDGALRAEAIAILRALDAAGAARREASSVRPG